MQQPVQLPPSVSRAATVNHYIHSQENRERAISIAISVLVVSAAIAALAWIVVSTYPPNPPVIQIEGVTDNPNPPHNPIDIFGRKDRTPARPSTSPASIIPSLAVSPISVPSIETEHVSADIGFSFGSDFGPGGIGSGPGGSGLPPGGPISQRCTSADRADRLRKAGGKLSTDRAVLNSLRWLKKAQKADGSFGGGKYPVAVTSLALLAFSGHCESVDSLEFGDTVRKAIDYLVGVADKSKGYLSSTGGNYAQASYEHGIAVYSLAEAYSINRNARKPFKRISPTLKKAVPIIIEGQTNGGGWLYAYGKNGTGDLSVAGWNIQALKAAELTKLQFSGLSTAKKKAIQYLKAAEDPNGSAGYFRYRVRDGQAGKLSLTGVGTLCSRMLGAPSKLEDKALDLIISKAPKGFGGADIYAWYYHSQAAFQAQGKHWRKYNDTYQEVVIDAQEKNGSWPAAGGHAPKGEEGKVYTTALCALMLEVYYRYLPATK